MINFPCTSCGLCCQKVGSLIAQAKKLRADGNEDAFIKEVAEFPYQTDKNGRCEKLVNNKTCSIYENRPDVCNFEVSYERFFNGESKKTYLKRSAENCNKMVRESHLPDYFLVKIHGIKLKK